MRPAFIKGLSLHGALLRVESSQLWANRLTLETDTGNGIVTGSFGRLRVKKTEKQEETERAGGLPGSSSRI